MVVRTVAIDDFITRAVREDGVDTVLNLAAGLDARPWRMPLPGTLRWVDVDLPEILGYKQRELANETPHCRYEARAIDLRDAESRQALFAEIAGASRRTFVLTEGLLIYLPSESVAALARDLAAHAALRDWAMDLMSPELMRRLNRRWGKTLARGNAPFLFAPSEGTRFFEPFGWREREFRSTWVDAKRLHRRMPNAWVYDLIMRMSPPDRRAAAVRFAGNVLLKQTRASG
jgi:methyltransferase (TIGR00027 family)